MVKLVGRIAALTALMVALTPGPTLGDQPVAATPADHAAWPVRAVYGEPTNRYPHNIMGRIRGWSRLQVDVAPCASCQSAGRQLRLEQPQSGVFEDFAPRLWDITGDGRPEIVLVESDQSKGARLVVWQVTGDSSNAALHRLATTAYLGTKFRWLAPVGAADFDGDGTIEIAYVEKPHLDRVLRLVQIDGNRLVSVAALAGVTNHAIGQEKLASLVRTCAGVPEIIALSGDGQHVLAITWEKPGLTARRIGQATEGQLPAGLDKC